MNTRRVLIGEDMMTCEAVLDQAARLTTGLSALGVGEGDSVALLLRNDFPYLVAGRAVRSLGAHVVLLNCRSTASEAQYILDDARPRAVVGHADLLCAVRDVLPNVPTLVVPTRGSEAESDDLVDRLLETVPGARHWSHVIAEHQPATGRTGGSTEAIIYTSGTTGRPKGVRRLPFTDDRGAQNTAEMARIFGTREGSRSLVLGPLYHSLPDTASKLALEMADLLVVQRKFDAELTLKQIQEHRITELALVPTMFVRLLKLPEEVRARYDVSSLRTVIHSGAPCPPDIKEAMIEWWGPILHELYGATEVGVTFYADSHDWLEKPGTVGRPMPGTVFEIIGADDQPVGPGHPGEVFARNHFSPAWEYIGREKETYGDGLVSVGDIGYVDADGFLFLCDRKNDLVISGGVNIYPAEIEAVVITHPAVADCAVFGAPDADLGEIAVLAVALQPGAEVSTDELRDFVRDRLSPVKVPKHVDVHDELPRQESGKVLRRQLRARYWTDGAPVTPPGRAQGPEPSGVAVVALEDQEHA